ncbi:regulatory protein RecX [Sphingosinicella terrae]|uniref:regulatory protein RecX n=1 Tax=Sphingosinicella terrae TaxID=2172047 RepID=UPI0025478CE9|nr:RecX family transcriptional regulator [Sphingosinicella terrae]
MAMEPRRRREGRPPYDEAGLEQAALSYAGRFATTRARLAAYLTRKLRERGWEGAGEPPVDRLVEKLASLGYVDDRSFAEARAAALGRRGYGLRRVTEALRAAGVGEEDGAEAKAIARDQAWEAALRFARRRRIGPFASDEPTPEAREKALAALLRAGHPLDLARRLARSRPGEVPEADSG